MDKDLQYYWSNKTGRKELASKHTLEMQQQYKSEIALAIQKSHIYSPTSQFFVEKCPITSMEIVIDSIDSTNAIFKYKAGKTAVLNFASYKEPGGGFLAGSRAQEECLCHDSFLYNVLSAQKNYYSWNNENKNQALYLNRAIYSPNIRFIKNGKSTQCDVITCAAPNYSTGLKYGNISKAENTKALDERIKFVLDIAAEQGVDTLILGAFGCGVFKQDPTEVANIFLRYLKTSHKCFKKIVFAIPADVNQINYLAFYKALED